MILKILKQLLNINDQDNVKYLIDDTNKSLTVFVNKENKNEMENN